MGETNISYQNLKAAYGGLSEAKKVAEWKYDLGEEQKGTLNAINMLGYTNVETNQNLASEIWNGTKNVEYKNLNGEYGYFNASEDSNKVILSDSLLGKGKEASAMLATVMSHEGTHVYGNRIEGVAHLAGLQTYSQIDDMFKLKGNEAFTKSIEDAINDENSWKKNTGDVDYWKLNRDGSIEYDGKADLYDENGNLIYETKKRGLECSFIEILYGEKVTDEQKKSAVDLLEKNFSHYVKNGDKDNRNNWYWDTNENEGKSVSVDQYEDIYKTRVLKDSITGVEATIENHNPYNIYKKMVSDGTMDIKEEYQNGVSGKIKGFFAGKDKYISYDDFKANNYITGGIPEYTINTPVPEGSDISTLFGAMGTSAAGTLKTHAGIDFAVGEGTAVYPMISNSTTVVLDAHNEDSYKKTIQGKYVLVRSNFSYNYKGSNIDEKITQSYDHLKSTSLKAGDSISSTTLLGLSGNTGEWNGKGYGSHLHTDIYTNLKTSPMLNYIGMNYENKISNNLIHQSSLNTSSSRYYDPLAVLKNYSYKIRSDAWTY